MSDHARLSPSGRSRWGICAASVRAEAAYPDEPSRPAAIDGTHTHTLVETCVKANLSNPLDYVGKTLKDHEGDFVVNTERAKRAKVCVDYVKSLLGGETTILAETRVEPGPLVGRFDMSGTVDIQVRRSDVWHVIDLKDGGGVVEAVENPQLLDYAVGVLADGLAAQVKLPSTFRLTIVQPKLADRGLSMVSSWDIPIERVFAEAETLKAQAAATDAPDAPYTPGEVQCRYCKHRNNCTAKAEKVFAQLGFTAVSNRLLTSAEFSDRIQKTLDNLPLITGLDIAQQAANKNPAEMPDEQLRQILDAAPLMRQLLESVEDEALKRLQGGRSIAGLKLVNGRGSRAWAHAEDEMAAKLTKMGIPKGSVYVTKLVSPAQAEKLTWAKRDGTQVQLTPRQLERMDKEFVIKLAGKLTVVSESDSRPAVVLDASPLFKPIEGLKEKGLEDGDRVLVMGVKNMPDGLYRVGTPVTASPAVPESPALPDWLSS